MQQENSLTPAPVSGSEQIKFNPLIVADLVWQVVKFPGAKYIVGQTIVTNKSGKPREIQLISFVMNNTEAFQGVKGLKLSTSIIQETEALRQAAYDVYVKS
jgi:hypothetical protein